MVKVLISARELLERVATRPKGLRIVDCSWSLDDPSAGRRRHIEGHIPGAIYANLETDLSKHTPDGSGGRHPLPPLEDSHAIMHRLGITREADVVVYDDTTGFFATRLWWWLTYLQHPSVVFLDGGLAAWKSAGGAIETGESSLPHTPSIPSPAPPTAEGPFGAPPATWMTTSFDEVSALVDQRLADRSAAAPSATTPLLIDARPLERHLGKAAAFGERPGHIPTAASWPFSNAFAPAEPQPDGAPPAPKLFKPQPALREGITSFLAERGGPPITPTPTPTPAVTHGDAASLAADPATWPTRPVVACGSGVSATTVIAAFAAAGLPLPRLYVGSYSEWSASSKPVETDAV